MEDKKSKIETRYDEIFKVNITTTIPGDGSISLAFKYDESSGGNEITYKYKDPRDALHFITKYWKEISGVQKLILIPLIACFTLMIWDNYSSYQFSSEVKTAAQHNQS